MDTTYPYRVRAGQVLPVNGEVLEGGALVQLTRPIAHEVRHLVDPIDADGHVIDPPTPEQIELEERPQHEHASILNERRARLVASLRDAMDVADRVKAEADAARDVVSRLSTAIRAIDVALTTPTAVTVLTPAPDVPAEQTEE